MSIFQIIAALFALFMIYVVSIHNRKVKLSATELGFWIATWSLFIIFALFPNLLTGITSSLNFARTFDLLLVVSLMVLTVIVVTSYFIQRENAQKLEDLIRKIALDRADQSKRDK